MRAYDFSPLYRSAIGFDRLAGLLDTASRLDAQAPSYPPFNVERVDENEYRVTMAVAGFTEDELEIEVKDQTLTISGKKVESDEDRNFLHRGIATRSFERRFQLADHVQVTGAQLENGLLHVDTRREIPEALKPRTIAIQSSANGNGRKVIENTADAA
ncbi:Hsp20 family protein [Pyruvatibacter mobilis]|jgi:molecular chaperone IbpA|uniref:Hsp20 family protein n=1 Tax=Pyruvatibacter mobilis TaxID=1712261 RepID=A0A845Q7R7_9HYPH|nr:Hsp20 family protein [Pyruvatibacter mobilis]NBG94693.1 Hsp20 family protein [Pyruvatibacter mobilis]QJD74198.1 Hsp20 family protein [Pyruvatibacter mobilis]GGD04933.1 heat-shock protein IbpA [Pyruvatibacter mobilis]